MSELFDTTDPSALLEGMRRARAAIATGKLVVLPTDTVYGVGANAFSAPAVAGLLSAKGRGRQSPPPVLIPSALTLPGLATDVPTVTQALTDAFWPGGLTIILDAQPSLTWDLGDSNGTVALRVPNHPLALELLAETGPLAVSSANRTGEPAALTAAQAQEQLGESVSVYLEAGRTPVGEASTIVDLTPLSRNTGLARILRHGAVTAADLRSVLGTQLEPDTDAVA
ncbi:MAG: L-threonylcarbamoyladenylate synthase [Microbacteriaceae bacterium]|jgi:tRNA threonylcarbamoyl adenosine modification protein (Sua5/YciO/YrdC/YwlC family)